MPPITPPAESAGPMEVVPPGMEDSTPLGVPEDLSSGPESVPMGEYGDYHALHQSNCDMWGCQPALTASSGTWLRRGWWYTEIEAVVLNRMWKRDDMTLGQDSGSTRKLLLKRSDPGAAGNVRLTLGRFLFRDVENRDHTIEFTAFGGGESTQDDTLTSSTDGQTLFVPTGISDFNPAFDGAESMVVDYDSRFNSFEVNYRVKERLRRDRMMLTPGGEWVRTTNEGLTKQFLFGLRYFDLVDTLDWSATNISTFANEDGNYHVVTNNDMFGVQLGCSLLYERDRWNVELMGKGGPYINDVKAKSRFTITNDEDSSYSVNNRDTTLSFIGEMQLVGRYHLRPNISLKAGWQMMYVSAVAIAPDQLNFSPDEGRFPYTGDPFYNGGIFGLECYW
ncbi:BBP7 family outer membrane beta-barrel protein [Aeoliella sp. ICT_H6.2]|uniref:BBP7 family outer membrane beta-barrel protein n=1 Tax=Aeoliella straminimaris TaxID=2954799 RepID=A0A9X2F7Z8_9BACT|nr:BBP7 family outer membrane beta-barrel protein [Aeoliella straminimaris]MCO6043353.1 BBP7 family outer membrane beta-barrel protein [Aeoliella straminimaris]